MANCSRVSNLKLLKDEMNNSDSNFLDDFGSIMRANPDENFVDISVEMSSFRTMLMMFANKLLEENRITTAEYEDFFKVYNLSVRGDIFGYNLTARTYKNRIAIANSAKSTPKK